MSLFSFFRKNKQETAADDNAFYARSESESESPAVRSRKRKSTGKPAAESGSDAPVDPVLPEKKRARRRLVGAVALVLTVIIGLPMVLDSEPKLLPDDLIIDIPSKERPPAPSGASTPVAKLADGKPQAVSAPAPVAAGIDQKEEVVDMGPAAEAAPAKSKAEPVVIAKAEPKPEPAAIVKTTPKPVAPKHEPKVVTPVPEPKIARVEPKIVLPKPEQKTVPVKPAAEDIADGPHTKFTLQVAALATTEKADELRNRLKDAGIASYAQRIGSGSGERVRIRIGPLNSREDAERLRARLALLGLSGTLVPAPL